MHRRHFAALCCRQGLGCEVVGAVSIGVQVSNLNSQPFSHCCGAEAA